jgi:thioredoxin-related protein
MSKSNFLAALLVALILTGFAASVLGQMPEQMHHKKGGTVYAPDVNWKSLKDGRKLAKKEKKPMLVDFAVPEDCDRCEFFENNVYNKKEITDKINSEFIPVWIDLNGPLTMDEQALGDKFDFKNDCLTLFLDYKGVIIEDPEGKEMCFVDEIEPEVFIEYLDYVREEYVPSG